jgi:hypothetical protein
LHGDSLALLVVDRSSRAGCAFVKRQYGRHWIMFGLYKPGRDLLVPLFFQC